MFLSQAKARYLTRGLAVFGAGAFVLHAWRLALTLGGASRRYRLDRDQLPGIDSEDFLKYVAVITDAQIHRSAVSVLRNGDEFYAAELEAVRGAQRTINLEAYEFLRGKVTREFLDALTERAQNGVEVRMVVDAVGSLGTRSSYFDRLRSAGGKFAWYHPVDAKSWPYLNRRSHRKLLVIDGSVGFMGGADFADHWRYPNKYGPRWRDTVFRLTGPAASRLNSVFAENWLESTGEILAGASQFPAFSGLESGVPAMVVSSTPHSGATHARLLYQAFLEAARKSIHITTPYFVPDRSARTALERAARRGITVKILPRGRIAITL